MDCAALNARWKLRSVKRRGFAEMGEPSEVADMVVFLASERAAYVSGTVVTVDGGATNRNL